MSRAPVLPSLDRAARRRKAKEARAMIGEIRRMLAIDDVNNPKLKDWLNAIEMAGFYYEYVSQDEGIYGIYEDVERTDLRALLFGETKSGVVIPFIPS